MTDMITPDMSVEFLDEVPESGNPVSTGELACIVCNAPLTYGGRGPKPKYCDEHRKSGSKSSSPSSNSKSQLALIERAINELTIAYRLGAQGLKFIQPVIGETVEERADKLAESYRPLLETNKKFRDMFAKTEQSMAYLPLLMAHGDLVVSIMLAMKIQAAQQALSFQSETGNGV